VTQLPVHATKIRPKLWCLSILLFASAVHEGAFLPFSAGAASYKSSETESSGMESTEEDTISCRAAGTTGGISSKGNQAEQLVLAVYTLACRWLLCSNDLCIWGACSSCLLQLTSARCIIILCCLHPAEPGSVKRSTAPLNSHSSSTPAAGLGSNTATLATGLKRFGEFELQGVLALAGLVH
jgi:hypothetical protein